MNTREIEDTWRKQIDKLLPRLIAKPYCYDYFSLLRQLESVHLRQYGKLGHATSPKQERIRVVQEPSLAFQAANIQSVRSFPDYIEISLNGFGLFGTAAPLPLHLTEYAYERKHHHGDSSWVGFANIFQHRLAVLFYRAWANAQSITSLDKEVSDDFGGFITSLNGLIFSVRHNQPEHIHPYAIRYFSGLLMPQGRSSANLQDLLKRYFAVPVWLENNIGYWIDVPQSEQTEVGQSSMALGDGLLLGDKLYDVASRFRIILGPLSLCGYRSFFKQQKNAKRLVEWIQIFVGIEYEWDVQPILAHAEIPPFQLNGQNQLGLTSWLGEVGHDANDLVLQYS